MSATAYWQSISRSNIGLWMVPPIFSSSARIGSSPALRDRRRDDLLVDGVEIGHTASRVELLTERHQHEAERRERFSLVQELLPSNRLFRH